MSHGPVLELAPITLRAGVDEATLLAASERLERDFLQVSPGYLGRALTRDASGNWMDVVLWADEASAQAILPRIPDSAACAAYFACMQGADTAAPEAGVTHLRAVRAFGAFARP